MRQKICSGAEGHLQVGEVKLLPAEEGARLLNGPQVGLDARHAADMDWKLEFHNPVHLMLDLQLTFASVEVLSLSPKLLLYR